MRPATQTKRIVVAAAIGNGLIVYDFMVYSFSAVIIGQLFPHRAARLPRC